MARDIEDAVKAALKLACFKPVKGTEYFGADALPNVLDVIDNWPGAWSDPGASPIAA